MALRTVGVRLTAEISDYMTNMRRAGVATQTLSGEMKKAADGGHLDKVADRAAVAGLALGGMATYAIKAAADFDKAMSAVSAATHASADQIAALRKAALEAGKDTQYSATQAAGAITELSKAGVSTADVLNGGLRGALSLAAAGQLDVSEAAETAASALTQFKLKGSDVPHVADLLAAAAGKAQGSVHDMGFALNQSGLVASQFGLSIEDTTGALAEFANAGLIGSDAGTSFKTMLLAMANPSDITKNKMNELGISFYDARGRFIGLSEVAQELQQKLGGVSQETRQSALAQIFGNDAVRAASVLYADGAAGVEKWKNAVNDSGYASQTAAKLTDNLAGDLERLKGSLETLAIQSGSGANGGLRQLVQLADTLVDRFGALPPVVGSTVTVMAGLSAAVLVLGAGWLKVRKTSAEFRAELEAMGPAGERAASGLSRVGSAAGKVGAAFAALQVAGAVINQFQGDLNPQLEALGVGLEEYAKSGVLAGESSRLLGGDLGKLQGQFQILADTAGKQTWARNIQSGLESIVPGLNKTDTSLANTKERVNAIDSALAGLVQGGNAQQASEAFNRMAAVLATGGVSMEEFRKQFPQYAAALEVAKKNTAGAAAATDSLTGSLDSGTEAQKDFKTATDAAAAATHGQRSALVQLATFMKGEVDPVFGFIEAQKNLTEAQDKATAAIKKHGKSSEEAKAATRDLTLAAIDLQGKAGALSQTFDGKVSPSLLATLRAGKLTDTQLKILEGQFKDAKTAADKYDGKYEAKTSAPGAKDAKKDLDNAYTAANHFAGPYRANVSVTNYADAKSRLLDLISLQYEAEHPGASRSDIAENRREKARFLATGGPVYGPGTATSDSIPARLSAGEHVWTAAEVQALGGQGAMMSLRAAVRGGRRVEYGDETPGFAGGGAVLPYLLNMARMAVPTASAVPSGGAPGYKWMERVIRSAFPGLHVISDFRPGAVTLTGNRSYHAVGRAVDYPPSKPLAEWINLHYKAATKELITPWNSLNIHNGSRHTYTGAVFRQHNFAGGNAHDHWAMAGGGTIREPVFGVGASGDTYSFGENYMPERVSNWRADGGRGSVTVNLNFSGPVGSRLQLQTWVTEVIDDLKSKGRI